MSVLIVAASALCAGFGAGLMFAVWLGHTWVRREEERTRSHERLLDECSWYQTADYVHFSK